MKDSILSRRLGLSTAVIFVIFSLFCCGNDETNNTTFINTGADTNGRIFTIYSFDKVLSVTAKDLSTDETAQIDKFEYNPTTTELILSETKQNTVYHVSGTCPGRMFRLYDAVSQPLVIVDYARLDAAAYHYDAESKLLTINTIADLDKTPYFILWLTTEGGEHCLGNTIDYDKIENIVLAWLQEQSE